MGGGGVVACMGTGVVGGGAVVVGGGAVVVGGGSVVGGSVARTQLISSGVETVELLSLHASPFLPIFKVFFFFFRDLVTRLTLFLQAGHGNERVMLTEYSDACVQIPSKLSTSVQRPFFLQIFSTAFMYVELN